MSDIPSQADLRLVNLVSRGYTMAEARKKLGLDKPRAKPSSVSEKPASATSSHKCVDSADEALL